MVGSQLHHDTIVISYVKVLLCCFFAMGSWSHSLHSKISSRKVPQKKKTPIIPWNLRMSLWEKANSTINKPSYI